MQKPTLEVNSHKSPYVVLHLSENPYVVTKAGGKKVFTTGAYFSVPVSQSIPVGILSDGTKKDDYLSWSSIFD